MSGVEGAELSGGLERGVVAVATDDSDGANQAVEWAIEHADRHDFEVVAIRVVPSSEPTSTDGEEAEAGPRIDLFDRTAIKQLELEMTAALERRRAGARVIVTPAEDVAEAIVEQAAQAGATMLVVGNGGMRGRKEFLLGNVANRITHTARCTVVVVNSAGESIAEEDPGEGGASAELRARAAEISRVLGGALVRQLANRVLSPERADMGPRELRDALEQLGPAFGKLGQILSTRPDLVPQEYIDELSSLQSSVQPMSEAEVVGVMEDALGVPWEDVFGTIDPEPLAAGTIGQVHRATLADGQRVVVKVQRPQARRLVDQDLTLLEGLSRRASKSRRVNQLIDLPSVVQQLGSAFREELDFLQEAENLERMATLLAPYPHLDVPRHHPEISSPRLLVMDEITDAVPVAEAPEGEARAAAASELLQSYYRQVLEDGFFHADPHPGNLLWADEKIWLLDLGMVGQLDKTTRRQLVLLLLAFAQGDVGLLADVSLDLGGTAPSTLDIEDYERDLQLVVDAVRGRPLRELQLAEILTHLTQISVRHNVPLPASLVMVGKALGQVQMAVTEIEPDIDPIAEAGRFLSGSIMRRLADRLDPQELIYEAEKLRYRLTQVGEGLATVAGNRPGRQLEVRFTSAKLERSVTKAGRTVALGLSTGLAWIAATVASSSDRIDPKTSRAIQGLAAGLSAGLAADLLRDRSS